MKITLSNFLLFSILLILGTSCSFVNKEKIKGEWVLYRIGNDTSVPYNKADETDKVFILSFDDSAMFQEYDGSLWKYKLSTITGKEIWTDYKNLDYGDENLKLGTIKELTDEKLVIEFHVLNRMQTLGGGGTLLYFKKAKL